MNALNRLAIAVEPHTRYRSERHFRKERGLSQQAMTDAMAIDVNSLKKYESGQAQPSLDALGKIATTRHTSTDLAVR